MYVGTLTSAKAFMSNVMLMVFVDTAAPRGPRTAPTTTAVAAPRIKKPKTLEKERDMTVEELIKLLRHFDDQDQVHITYPSGDYWHTQLAPKVTEVDNCHVQYSSYHSMDKVSELDEGEVDEDGKTSVRVVVIG
jgi:hypothetical protein